MGRDRRGCARASGERRLSPGFSLPRAVLSCPVHVCPELGRQGWRLQGQTSEVSGYFWNFIEERRDREPRAGGTKGKRVHRLEKQGPGRGANLPRADGSRGGELLSGGEEAKGADSG